MSPPIERYLELSSLSSSMVDAARSGDWERLDALEQRVAALRSGIAGAPASDAALVGGLICKILDDDAEVRRHTEPWMEQLRLLLAGHLNGWRLPPSQPGDEPDGCR